VIWTTEFSGYRFRTYC